MERASSRPTQESPRHQSPNSQPSLLGFPETACQLSPQGLPDKRGVIAPLSAHSARNQRMKILITADLHYRGQWFRLLSRAAEWDLVCIAGDLLDMFNEEPRIM